MRTTAFITLRLRHLRRALTGPDDEQQHTTTGNAGAHHRTPDIQQEHSTADIHLPGLRVPKTGEVTCTKHTDSRKHVKAGGTFGLCEQWLHDHQECGWEYV